MSGGLSVVESIQLQRVETEVKERKNKASENTHLGFSCEQTKYYQNKQTNKQLSKGGGLWRTY
jgi:hypothetical protein